jgi:spore maturation protein CgeB
MSNKPSKILCVFGQFQYGMKGRGESLEYVSFIPALRGIGCDVRHFESWDRMKYVDFADLNQKLIDEVLSFRPDIVFTVQMEYEIWLETLDTIRSFEGVVTISWAADDTWKYRQVSRFIAPSYHLMTTTYLDMLSKYHADGIQHVFPTQWAANSINLHEPLPAAQCKYQVSFIGQAHGDRRKRIERLRSDGINVACFGHGWENGPVSSAEYADIIRNSAISLNFANSRGQDQLKARCFEVPGAGGFLLTEAVDGLARYYQLDEEVVVFYDEKELVKKIQHYLSCPDLRDSIAMAGYRRTLADHLYEHRLTEILNFASTIPVSNSGINVPDLTVAVNKYRNAGLLRLARCFIEAVTCILFGRTRATRAARRLVFELSWRLAGRHTFTASGWPGRMFPDC